MTRRIAVFAGPSLPPNARPSDRSLHWFPPAATGDILRLVGEDFDCVCLIDGYFDHRPAPWHKELLALMAAGTHLIGSSSMGALRAAELDRFGMEGVGAIYHAYRAGLLTGDDEVALVHGPEAIGWAAASVPMIEVRATLVEAVRRQIIDVAAARSLRVLAQAVYYADRDWPLLEKEFEAGQVVDATAARQISRLHVPLKQHDAERCVATALAGGEKPEPFTVPVTSFLRALQAEISGSQAPFE